MKNTFPIARYILVDGGMPDGKVSLSIPARLSPDPEAFRGVDFGHCLLQTGGAGACPTAGPLGPLLAWFVQNTSKTRVRHRNNI